MKNHIKLFIPGPVEVSPSTLQAFASPMIGHRSPEFQSLYREVQTGLQKLFQTQGPVFVSTSSAWGVMEAAIRNLVARRVLCCANGAFSDKWYDVALRCGKEAEKLSVPWGKPITPEQIEPYLQTGRFDALTLVHNETSTGLMNPLEEIAQLLKHYPEVSFLVDCVSSFSAVPTPFEQLGADVLLTGSQKALALPPGISLFAVSERALQKARSIPARGFYFDFLEFEANHRKSMTPSTPSISHFFALRHKLAEIFQEGLEARYERHRRNAELVRHWALSRGFELFPARGFESVTLTCIRNTRGIDVGAWIARLRERFGCVIDGGYGKIRGMTFRISHMGDETPQTIQNLLEGLDRALDELGG
ncbi:pyridoxal-phosphate-dependent aminotransferase family protein [Candidatus Methylacidithermus pantelleriae]|uniref:Serine-glyoxylate aminotransferase n=1 Tax=Candidatus Methylacidithermus pantelleriae TaxID=2744239 RepID=A0A8J2BS98_9BACT|nr:alanine--glyoxylate aminotransferase family protein [Candidatus Methylacidithermus pantelleriae]CAF0703669.1 Serine-glyoxylate aminotransferase [Candidatus Methylacidithermus pantelleriae]